MWPLAVSHGEQERKNLEEAVNCHEPRIIPLTPMADPPGHVLMVNRNDRGTAEVTSIEKPL